MGLKKVKTRAGIFWEEMVRTLALWGALEREGVIGRQSRRLGFPSSYLSSYRRVKFVELGSQGW